jgi:hypothetical protein
MERRNRGGTLSMGAAGDAGTGASSGPPDPAAGSVVGDAASAGPSAGADGLLVGLDGSLETSSPVAEMSSGPILN